MNEIAKKNDENIEKIEKVVINDRLGNENNIELFRKDFDKMEDLLSRIELKLKQTCF